MSYRAVVFDLWDTLVVWPQGEWNNFYGRMADSLGIDRERFTEAWGSSTTCAPRGRSSRACMPCASTSGWTAIA